MKDYLVRASALQGYRETTRHHGVDPEPLLAGHGLSGVDPDSEAWISYRAWLELLEHTADVTGIPCFGLRLSARQDINILGAVGIIMQQAPDVRAALQELTRYFSYHNQGAVVSPTVASGVLSWTFTPRPALHVSMRQQSDLVAGLGCKIMRLLHPDWKPQMIYLPHSAPADRRLYREVFQCPIHFDWETTIITSDAAFLDIPLQQANPRLHKLLERHFLEMRQNLPEDYPARVSYLIRQALQTGDCSVERVSAYLAVNKRTLQRNLRVEGTSYKNLLDDVRFEMACNYLRDSDGPLTSLAHMLCYSELSAFTNAFRRRFGVSPRQWRKEAALT